MRRKSLFVFRRDYRLQDNTGLINALRNSETVVPCFIFDPRQTEDHPYKSDNALQFLIESLKDLDRQLRLKGSHLYLFQGEAEKVISYLIRAEEIDAVYFNRDYTPFSRRRDEAVASVCRERGAAFEPYADALLNEPEHITKPDGKPYTVFTPFLNASRFLPVRMPQDNSCENYYRQEIMIDKGESVYTRVLERRNADLFRKGGRDEALKILRDLEKIRDYESKRDVPAFDGTTGLSPHIKFGTVSIREIYHEVKKKYSADHALVRQLYWRDFFTHIGYHFDRVFGQAFHNEYDFIPWDENPDLFERWKLGTTGFPIVDAGMRQLAETGSMHNRVRMICASFLVKDLHIDWREGERYFATKLEDYDPCVNNGNWQWVASTGCDAAPYFRIFNPWLQQKKFDPDAAYIKKWVLELKDVPAAVIHELHKKKAEGLRGYPHPVLEHAAESKRALELYRFVKDEKNVSAEEE